MILGLLERQDGQVIVFGRDPALAGTAVRARLGVLPERNGVYEWMTADTHLRFFAELRGRDASAQSSSRILERVGLAAHKHEHIGRFSRGMRQRLGVARALLGEPELLILDEPTNGLDPRGRSELHDLLRELAATQSLAVLLCTHLLDDVERLCGRVGVIVAGRTVAEGSLAELTRQSDRGRRLRMLLAAGAEADLPGSSGSPFSAGATAGTRSSCPMPREPSWRGRNSTRGVGPSSRSMPRQTGSNGPISR